MIASEMDSEPRSLRDPKVRALRRKMLDLPHMIELKKFAEALRSDDSVEVPDFDPLDGGVEAQLLFLFEKPGPLTSGRRDGKRSGSGFISRDNDDPTAEAVFNFMREAGIQREITVLWNLIPRWNGTRAITPMELREGSARATELIRLLSCLRAVVLVGKRAAMSRVRLDTLDIAVFTSLHPSPLVKARWPDRWSKISSDWRKAAALLA